MKMKSKSSFPDLTGDGKVTRKDILKGRNVEGFKEGGSINMNSADIPQRKRMAMGAEPREVRRCDVLRERVVAVTRVSTGSGCVFGRL